MFSACVSKSHIMMTSLFRRSQLSTIRVVLIHNIDKMISLNLPKSFFCFLTKGCVVHLFARSLCYWFAWDFRETSTAHFSIWTFCFLQREQLKPLAEVTHYSMQLSFQQSSTFHISFRYEWCLYISGLHKGKINKILFVEYRLINVVYRLIKSDLRGLMLTLTLQRHIIND